MDDKKSNIDLGIARQNPQRVPKKTAKKSSNFLIYAAVICVIIVLVVLFIMFNSKKAPGILETITDPKFLVRAQSV